MYRPETEGYTPSEVALLFRVAATRVAKWVNHASLPIGRPINGVFPADAIRRIIPAKAHNREFELLTPKEALRALNSVHPALVERTGQVFTEFMLPKFEGEVRTDHRYLRYEVEAAATIPAGKYSAEEAADLLNIAAEAVHELVRAGVLTPPAKGRPKYPIPAIRLQKFVVDRLYEK